ncbi:hypothetical protein ACHAAC_17030 [Aeromicrobium sp. CF4.19]|uniref:hypothetical protein n=1 Tax=Aeromicrobium sp. CF4.19 TaxID=3373082 RepID=UPI003EE70E31
MTRADRGRQQDLSASYRYAAGRPVGFVDESMRLDPRRGMPFYTMTGVLIDHSALDEVRRDVQRVGRSPGGRPWHTTDAYEQGRYEQIERMVALVAERTEWSIVTVDAPMASADVEGERLARASCIRRLIPELTRGDHGSRVVIMDHRSEAGDRDDMRIAAEIRGSSDGRLRHLHLRHASDDQEPLLCTPDVAGWAARRLLTVDETRWIEPARDVVTIVHASSGKRFSVDDLAPERNNAGQASAIPASSDPMTRRRAMRPELLSSPVSQPDDDESTLDRLVRRARERPERPPGAPRSAVETPRDPPIPER